MQMRSPARRSRARLPANTGLDSSTPGSGGACTLGESDCEESASTNSTTLSAARLVRNADRGVSGRPYFRGSSGAATFRLLIAWRLDRVKRDSSRSVKACRRVVAGADTPWKRARGTDYFRPPMFSINTKNSLLPAGPSKGDSVTPCQRRPNRPETNSLSSPKTRW